MSHIKIINHQYKKVKFNNHICLITYRTGKLNVGQNMVDAD